VQYEPQTVGGPELVPARTSSRNTSRAWLLRLVLFLSACAIASVTTLVSSSAPARADTAQWMPVLNSDFPDPSVLSSGGSYYAYSTEVGLDIVPEEHSPDALQWNGVDGGAMPALPPWASFGATWSPTVQQDSNGQFVMFYSAQDSALGVECIGRAVAGAASGPFVDSGAQPALCQASIGGSIDPDIFVANSGASYLVWKNNGNAAGTSNDLWSQPLDADFELVGAPSLLLAADQDWQGGNIEGPAMLQVSGGFDLFYAANDYSTASYSIGFATCSSPLGPCSDKPGPVFASQPGAQGPGGPSFFKAGSNLVMAFAAWPGAVGYASGGYRAMYLATVTFAAGGQPSFTPFNAQAVTNGSDSNSPATSSACTSQIPAFEWAVGIAATPTDHGYWIATDAGDVIACGDAQLYGSMGDVRLKALVVGIAATGDGKGYWLVASDGGVFSFGDAPFYGSMGGTRLNESVVGMARDPATGGYWLVAGDGGIFSFDAPFYGSTGDLRLNQPVVGMSANASGTGYWLVASDGGVFTFGDVGFYGSMGGRSLDVAVSAIAADTATGGYWLVAADGEIFTFDAPAYGRASSSGGETGVIDMESSTPGSGYRLLEIDGAVLAFGSSPLVGSPT
jgi:hypothetical protein